MIYLLLLPLSLCATDLNPWFNPMFTPQIKATAGYRGGHNVDTEYLIADVAMTVWNDIKAEIEIEGAKTRKNDFNYESARVSGFYRFKNDAIGDDLSIVGGLTVAFPAGLFTRDIGVYEPGTPQFLAHLIVGRECDCTCTWSSRVWGFLTFGIARHSSPWLKGGVFYELNLFECGRFRGGFQTLTGFGNHRLKPFHSYSNVAARELSLLLSYRYEDYEISGVQTLYHNQYPSTTSIELSYYF